jgi:hypothetical protein
VDMDVIFTPVIGELVKTLVGKGASAIEDNEQVTTLRMLLRERLRREVRFNRELLSENQLDLSVRIDKLETEVLEYVCAQAVPLEKLFNKALDSDRMRFFAGENASHKMHMAMLGTEAQLIERLLHRTKLAKLRVAEGVRPGDVSYLKKLIQALQSTLS